MGPLALHFRRFPWRHRFRCRGERAATSSGPTGMDARRTTALPAGRGVRHRKYGEFIPPREGRKKGNDLPRAGLAVGRPMGSKNVEGEAGRGIAVGVGKCPTEG